MADYRTPDRKHVNAKNLTEIAGTERGNNLSLPPGLKTISYKNL